MSWIRLRCDPARVSEVYSGRQVRFKQVDSPEFVGAHTRQDDKLNRAAACGDNQIEISFEIREILIEPARSGGGTNANHV